jgi:hypothetical protein
MAIVAYNLPLTIRLIFWYESMHVRGESRISRMIDTGTCLAVAQTLAAPPLIFL